MKTRSGNASDQAFGSLEKLATLSVIGMLGMLFLPIVFPDRPSQLQLQSAAGTQIGAFQTALDMFKADNGYYPTGMN
ncbi:MAG TPA: hypothetical protein VN281_17345, partial [Verrucomicrobiae bacterium]|nr:hypothetical protein [Verrucomicrobiae bacterium]